MHVATPFQHSRERSLVLAVVALVGLGAALTGALLVGERADDEAPAPAADTSPAPAVSPVVPPAPDARPPDAPDAPASKPAAPPIKEAPRSGPPPARTTGRGSTREPSRSPQRGATRAPGAPAVVDPNAPGSLLAISNPTGARLFVDEALVGTTPLLLPGLSPGVHQIRMELVGFQPSSATVEIEPTRRFRLEVKLEQQ